jgi:hypothetical protein
MALGKGGSSQNQSGYQSGQQSGNTSGSTTGTSSGTSSGSSTSSGSVTPTTTPQFDTWNTNLGALFSPSGLNAGQRSATDAWSSYLTNPNNAVSQIIGKNQQLEPFTSAGPNLSAGAPTVSASTAYDASSPYRAAYGSGVLDPALADYDTGVARSGNAFRAGSIAGGSTGGAYGSSPVGAGVLAGEAARGRGMLSAGIRGDILDKSFGLGGSDSNRTLAADSTNAGNTLRTNEFNAGQRDRATEQQRSAIQQQVGNAATEMGLGSSALQQWYGMEGGGMDNILRYMGIQPQGQSSTGSSSNTGSTSGSTSTSSTGAYSGSSSGTSSGNASGKNGGISL